MTMEVKEVNEVIATLEVIDDTLAYAINGRTNVANSDNSDNFDNFRTSDKTNVDNFDNFRKNESTTSLISNNKIMTKKLFSMLALLCLTAAGAWAQTEQTVDVTPVTGQTNQWTLAMPAGNVVLHVEYEPELTATFKAANALTIEAGKATVSVTENGQPVTTATLADGKLSPLYQGQTVILTAQQGYKFRKVEVKENPVAEGHALTSAKFGEIVCSDGKAYAAADKDNLPKGVKAEALVCYADGEHGLALAMVDVKDEKMSWDNDRGANDGKTAAEWCTGWNTSHPITGATWLLASKTQWDNMISAAGSASNLSNAFSAVGGTNLQAYSYWSSTPNHGGSAAWFYYFPTSSWQWTYLNQDETGRYIRACLEW